MADLQEEDNSQVIYTNDDDSSELVTPPIEPSYVDDPEVGFKRKHDDDSALDEPPSSCRKVDNHTKVVATHYNELEEKGRFERQKSR